MGFSSWTGTYEGEFMASRRLDPPPQSRPGPSTTTATASSPSRITMDVAGLVSQLAVLPTAEAA